MNIISTQFETLNFTEVISSENFKSISYRLNQEDMTNIEEGLSILNTYSEVLFVPYYLNGTIVFNSNKNIQIETAILEVHSTECILNVVTKKNTRLIIYLNK